jgi:hypothetical protein
LYLASSTNGLSFSNFGFTSTPTTITQSKGTTSTLQTINKSTIDDLSKSTSTTKPTPVNDPPSSSISNNKKLLQKVKNELFRHNCIIHSLFFQD